MSTLLAVLLNEAGIPKPNVPSSTRKKIEANHNKKKDLSSFTAHMF